MTSAPQALTTPTAAPTSSASADRPLRINLEHWFSAVVLSVGIGEAGGTLTLVPIEQGADGLPHRCHEKRVRTALTLQDLEQLHQALGDFLLYAQGADPDMTEVLIKLPPDGSKRVHVERRRHAVANA